MSKKINFIKPTDLKIIDNHEEFILRKGFLHINEITIDKSGSSHDFVIALQEFNEKGNIEFIEDSDDSHDFEQLMRFGFIDIESNNSFLLFVGEKYRSIAESLANNRITIKAIENFIDMSDMITVNECKDTIALHRINKKYQKIFESYDHIYYMDDFCNLSRLRGFNRLTHALNIEITIGFIDNDNVYLTGIKPNYTGCYECLEKHIISKFPGIVSDYKQDFGDINKTVPDIGNVCILLGMIFKDMQNILKYKISSLIGNVVHMYTPNFEYVYNVNRKTSACAVCAQVNNVKFEEQNIRSVNIIKEVFLNDKD